MQVVFHFDACRIDQNGQYVRDSILVLKVAHSYTRIKSKLIALYRIYKLRLAKSVCQS